METTLKTTAHTLGLFSSPTARELWQHMNITASDLDYIANMSTTFEAATTTTSQYCSGADWKHFRYSFIQFHGIASTIVCVFGLVTNILNIIVLTRKSMVSPTNAILTGLAVADMLVMIDYLPFTLFMYVFESSMSDCVRYSYPWAFFIMFHAHLSIVCHNISIGLTVTLAVWRCIAVSHPRNNSSWCNMHRAKIAIASCYIFSPVFCIPIYLSFKLKLIDNDCPDKSYRVHMSELAQENGRLLEQINFWVYSVLIKILPCVALTILSNRLIRALYLANERHMQLKMRNNLLTANSGDRNCSERSSSCDWTTRMLLAVLFLFIITEFPQGILALLSGILGKDFFETCYFHFSEVMDLLALINSAINFILYCAMSRQFRQNFSQLFKPKIFNHWMVIPQENTLILTQTSTCV